MTGAVGSVALAARADDAALGAAAKAPAAPAAGDAPAPAASGPASALAQSEAVTLSPAAQATAKLLASAQSSDGIDHAAVAQIKAAIANGSYNVSPEDLANAIATVLQATKP